MRTCAELEDLLLVHAAEALEGDEKEEVCSHLGSGCPTCIGRLAEAQAVLAHLPLALDPVPPSPALRRRVLAAIRTDPAPAAAAPPARRRRIPALIAAGIAAAIALGFLGERTARERARIRSESLLAARDARIRVLEETVVEAERRARRLGSPEVAVIPLEGTPDEPGASGRILWDRERREWHLFAARLPPPGPGRTYELWLITEDQRRHPAGTFGVNADGSGELRVALPEGIGALALAAVTDEPAGGADQPTGTIRLLGRMPGG